MKLNPLEAERIIETLSARLAELVRYCDSASKEQGSGVALAWREVVSALRAAADAYEAERAEWDSHRYEDMGDDLPY